MHVDAEIEAPYANRICVHNSMPIYIEMRGRQLPSYQRESNLISMYINLYYYNEEQMVAKSASIHMDTIQRLAIHRCGHFFFSFLEQKVMFVVECN